MFSNTASMMRSALPRSSSFSDGVSLARRSAACASVMRPRLALAESVSLMRATPLSSASCVVSTMVTGKPALRKASADAGAHGAGAEDADRLDVAQLGVGADARQVGRLPLGEEGVLQGARIGAGGGLAEQVRARARCLPRAAGWSPPPPHRWRPWAQSARSGAARATRAPCRTGRRGNEALSILLLADAPRWLADLLLGKGDGRRHHVAVGHLVDQPRGGALLGVDEGCRVVISCRACSTPMARGRRCVPPAPGMMPSLISGRPSWRTSLARHAVVAAERQLQPAAERGAIDGRHHRLAAAASILSISGGRNGSFISALNSVMSAPGREELARARSTMALTPASALASAKAFSRPDRSAWPSALTGGLSMRMTAMSPCFCVSTIGHGTLLLLASARLVRPCLEATRLGAGLARRLLFRHEAFQGGYAYAARDDDGPAAAGLERDRLCSRSLSRREDRIADRGGRHAPLRLRRRRASASAGWPTPCSASASSRATGSRRWPGTATATSSSTLPSPALARSATPSTRGCSPSRSPTSPITPRTRALFFDLTFLPLVEKLAPALKTIKTYVLMTDREHMPANGQDERPAVLRGPAGRGAGRLRLGPSSTRTPPARSATRRAPPASPRACSIPTARCCCTRSS